MAALVTEQLECLLDCTVDSSVYVVGVFPADRVPLQYSPPTKRFTLQHGLSPHFDFDRYKYYCFILNTHPSSAPGEHWLAFFLNRYTDKLEYFDSFGFQLVAYPDVHAGLNCCELIPLCVPANNVGMLQSLVSTVCGHYCVAFLLWRSRHTRANVGYFARCIKSSYETAHLRDRLIVELLREVTVTHPCCSAQLFGMAGARTSRSLPVSQTCCCRERI
jgi:hypothetical protein